MFVERLWRTVKYEDVYLRDYADGWQAERGGAVQEGAHPASLFLWPVVGAEEEGGKAVLVEEIGPGKNPCPGVADGDGLGYFRGGNDHRVAVDHGIRPVEYPVRCGECKALQRLAVPERESFADCLLYTSPSPRDGLLSRMPSSA